MKSNPHRSYLSGLVPVLVAATMLAPVARAQTAADPGYSPPQPYLVIPPPGGPNPYLIYVPTPQPAPVFIVPPPPQAAPAPSPAPAPAKSSGPTLEDLGKRLSNYFTQEEQDLLVDYMKESVMAAFKGEEVFLPPDLAFKLEVLLVRMKKEGSLYMDNLMKQLEADLKRSLKEQFGAPPKPDTQKPQLSPASAPASSPAPQPAQAPNGSGNWLPPEVLNWLSFIK
jgi:hypothetical protein